jgi:hypothetical protein
LLLQSWTVSLMTDSDKRILESQKASAVGSPRTPSAREVLLELWSLVKTLPKKFAAFWISVVWLAYAIGAVFYFRPDPDDLEKRFTVQGMYKIYDGHRSTRYQYVDEKHLACSASINLYLTTCGSIYPLHKKQVTVTFLRYRKLFSESDVVLSISSSGKTYYSIENDSLRSSWHWRSFSDVIGVILYCAMLFAIEVGVKNRIKSRRIK